MQKIMIVEDDDIIASSIEKHLEKWNYDVFVVNNFENVLEDFRLYEPLLILLDISLPYYNGYYWCQEIRKESEVPIIFISSTSENMNIVMAMNIGDIPYPQMKFLDMGFWEIGFRDNEDNVTIMPH